MNTKVLNAVFQRNLVSYFSNPTGYVFICVFMALGSVAAFLPNEFFNANLASLHQLNYWFPFIMLVFAPAITMSIWAEERHRGTDEILLTLPAGDSEIVLGKYLSALAIYTCSLLFSLACNYWVLAGLGQPDVGLFLGTYLGYWLVGAMMLAIGMAASFLTSNLTIAYILGVLFNTPLVALAWADSTGLPLDWALWLKRLSVGGQLEPFGRGNIVLSGILFFVAVTGVMLYFCVILIGRRHWADERRTAKSAHYALRIGAMLATAFMLVIVVQRFDLRVDVTSEQINSLSEDTRTLLGEIDSEHPIRITAFLSPTVPEGYVRTKLDIENLLREIAARGGDGVRLRTIPTEPYSDEAELALRRYGIKPHSAGYQRADVVASKDIFLGVAFQCGSDNPVILPFVDRGIPVEYELIRSLCTVASPQRKRLGILRTKAELLGRPSNGPIPAKPAWRIVDELKKSYEVVDVKASLPIEDNYDVLLAVQPSSLEPTEMNNFIDAVRRGIPTAIFEDPLPPRGLPGTNVPLNDVTREKGDIRPLWKLLGIAFEDDRAVWQDHNPCPRTSGHEVTPEWLFVDNSKPQLFGKGPFNEMEPMTKGLQQMLLLYAGSMETLAGSRVNVTPLLMTSKQGGSSRVEDIERPYYAMDAQGRLRRADARSAAPRVPEEKTSYMLAAAMVAPLDDEAAAESSRDGVRAICVADLDMLYDEFFLFREMNPAARDGSIFTFDNVTFVLNAIDALAAEKRFTDLRKRRPKHRSLETIGALTAEARQRTNAESDALYREHEEKKTDMQADIDRRVLERREQLEQRGLSEQELEGQLQLYMQALQKKLDTDLLQRERARDRQVEQLNGDLQNAIRRTQDWYRFTAVVLPPVLPLVMAAVVLVIRRRKEREGVSATRLR